MALYGGSQSGRTGPYWRRQLGTTLPGERTGPELAAINALRAKMGQLPQGGPAQHTAMPAAAPPPIAPPGYGIPEGPPPGVQPGGLAQLQLPQLLALKAMLARVQGQPRQASPVQPQRSVLPQLHQAVPVKAHVRIVQPRPALGVGNLPSHLRGAYPA